ncbi:hypothetical protein J6590_039795 [Homalodisca vitripennis]|nr:hypothetical protein J6590_039795 [Homalodisca vitripennis]
MPLVRNSSLQAIESREGGYKKYCSTHGLHSQCYGIKVSDCDISGGDQKWKEGSSGAVQGGPAAFSVPDVPDPARTFFYYSQESGNRHGCIICDITSLLDPAGSSSGLSSPLLKLVVLVQARQMLFLC